MKNLASPKVVREIIERYGFRFNKKLGQNFLVDQNILNKIVEGAGISDEDQVLEVGPGIGTLTAALARRAKQVIAVELDDQLIPILRETLGDYDNVEVVHGDILKLSIKDLLQKHFGSGTIKVVANLPYYVTTPIVMMFLEEDLPLDSLTIMVQREVAERMKASPGGKDYGALTVAVQYYAKPAIIATVPPTVFMPPPNVDSVVIRLELLEEPSVHVEDKQLFFQVVHAAFGKRRKTLLNALSASSLGFQKDTLLELLSAAGIDGRRRGETLSLQEFADITNVLIKYKS